MCLVDSVVGKLAVLIFKAMSTSAWSVCVHVYIQPTSWKMSKFSCFKGLLWLLVSILPPAHR